jgi:hypothetical protein
MDINVLTGAMRNLRKRSHRKVKPCRAKYIRNPVKCKHNGPGDFLLFYISEISGRKIFCRRRSQDGKFCGIFVVGGLRTKNSTEFLMPEVPGRKILRNFCCRRSQDEKFYGISVAEGSGAKNSMEFRISISTGWKNQSSFTHIQNSKSKIIIL